MLASEYGKTFSETMNGFTPREAMIALEAIGKRKYNELKIQAQLHGAEMKEPLSSQEVKVEKLDEKIHDELNKKVMERLNKNVRTTDKNRR